MHKGVETEKASEAGTRTMATLSLFSPPPVPTDGPHPAGPALADEQRLTALAALVGGSIDAVADRDCVSGGGLNGVLGLLKRFARDDAVDVYTRDDEALAPCVA